MIMVNTYTSPKSQEDTEGKVKIKPTLYFYPDKLEKLKRLAESTKKWGFAHVSVASVIEVAVEEKLKKVKL